MFGLGIFVRRVSNLWKLSGYHPAKYNNSLILEKDKPMEGKKMATIIPEDSEDIFAPPEEENENLKKTND